MIKFPVRIVAKHNFDPQTDACVQCRRGRLQIFTLGPVDCDGTIKWREWLRLGPYPTWQLEPALNNARTIKE